MRLRGVTIPHRTEMSVNWERPHGIVSQCATQTPQLRIARIRNRPLHGAGAEPVQGFLAGVREGPRLATDFGCPPYEISMKGITVLVPQGMVAGSPHARARPRSFFSAPQPRGRSRRCLAWPLGWGDGRSLMMRRPKLRLALSSSWHIYLVERSPAEWIGTIEAVDGDAAIADAAKLYNVKDPQKLIAVHAR